MFFAFLLHNDIMLPVFLKLSIQFKRQSLDMALVDQPMFQETRKFVQPRSEILVYICFDTFWDLSPTIYKTILHRTLDDSMGSAHLFLTFFSTSVLVQTTSVSPSPSGPPSSQQPQLLAYCQWSGQCSGNLDPLVLAWDRCRLNFEMFCARTLMLCSCDCKWYVVRNTCVRVRGSPLPSPYVPDPSPHHPTHPSPEDPSSGCTHEHAVALNEIWINVKKHWKQKIL